MLDRASRGPTITSDGLRLLQDLRRSLLNRPRPGTLSVTGTGERPENVSATV